MKKSISFFIATVSLALLLSGCCFHCRQTSASWITSGKPQQLTFGDGNDMEAAVSPDGQRIAYENDADGALRIFVLDAASGENSQVAGGGGKGVMAAYPAWTPEGGLVYALSAPTGTAVEQVPIGGDLGCNLWLWREGEHTRLTKGLWRDFTPSVSPDGKKLWFTTSRGRVQIGDGSHLAALSLEKPEVPATDFVESAAMAGAAAVSPVVSPHGRLLAWAKADGAFANWRIMLGDAENPSFCCQLTDPSKMNCYAPRWSPDGDFIACTGYSVGDPGWGIYVIHVASGKVARLETQSAGNSKSPCWTPDGKALVYENNATGSYKLYRMAVAIDRTALHVQETAAAAAKPKSRWAGRLKPAGQGGGAGESLWLCADGHFVRGVNSAENGSFFERPTAAAFGKETFYVKVRFRVDKVPAGAGVMIAGHYAGGRPGAPAWQFYVDKTMHLRFASCNVTNDYVDIVSWMALELGKEYSAIGVHYNDGSLKLWIDGSFPEKLRAESGLPLEECLGVAVGSGWSDGRHPFHGELFSAECGFGEPAEMPGEIDVQALLALEKVK